MMEKCWVFMGYWKYKWLNSLGSSLCVVFWVFGSSWDDWNVIRVALAKAAKCQLSGVRGGYTSNIVIFMACRHG